MTHFLGEIRPASIVGQAPPITQPDKPRPHLIGPVLESCDDRSLAVALVAGKILDLNDFTSTTWNNRLLLVAFGEEEYQPWHHEVTIRKGDNLSLVINQFRQLLLSDSTS
jgi:hypothetical protein